jgi:hypothetical protein
MSAQRTSRHLTQEDLREYFISPGVDPGLLAYRENLLAEINRNDEQLLTWKACFRIGWISLIFVLVFFIDAIISSAFNMADSSIWYVLLPLEIIIGIIILVVNRSALRAATGALKDRSFLVSAGCLLFIFALGLPVLILLFGFSKSRNIKQKKVQNMNEIAQINFQIKQIEMARRRQIKDQEFDAWLESKAAECLANIIRTNGLETEIVNPKALLRVRGYVLRGFKEARNYRPNDICSKRGRDGRWRYSINLYTYFYPTEQCIIVFRCTINAMHWGNVHTSYQYCFYNDIVSITIENNHQDRIEVNGYSYNYRTERFLLQLNSGNSIQASVKSRPIDADNLPEYDIPDSRNEQAIRQLILMWRSKKTR